jgi:hypothetical protein
MALEDGHPVKFHVVLHLVPGLFYVKYLETNNVPRFHAFFPRVRIKVDAVRQSHARNGRTWNT